MMRTTLDLDEKLLAEAQRLTGVTDRTAIIHEGLRALITRESARRLARLGGSETEFEVPSRRRSATMILDDTFGWADLFRTSD